MKMKKKVTTQRVNLALLGLTAFCAAGLFTARMDSAKAEFTGPCPDMEVVFSEGAPDCTSPNAVYRRTESWGTTCAMGHYSYGSSGGMFTMAKCCLYDAYDLACRGPQYPGDGVVIGVHQVLRTATANKVCRNGACVDP